MARSLKETFNEIYNRGGWPGGRSDGTLSGVGSTLSNTSEARKFITDVIRNFGIKSVFDAPCGDYHWMRATRAEVKFDYFGGDIADVIIQGLNEKYANEETIFSYFDISVHPFIPADLWICRDCMIHLPTDTIASVLDNFRRSAIKYALITTHSLDENIDLDLEASRDLAISRRYRLVDMNKPPFNLPAPILSCRETDHGRAPKFLGLWTREQIAAV